jgi:hypothetical protein
MMCHLKKQDYNSGFIAATLYFCLCVSFSIISGVEDGINSNDSKKHGILYLFMWKVEPIPTTAKAWYSLLIHAEDGNNSNDSKSEVFFTYLCGGWNQPQR